MTARYIAWFTWLIPIEGTRYECDPKDPGGATKFGIDQRSHPKLNIKALTLDDARLIYWQETWTANRADELPDGVGEVVCRIAMNCGPEHAAEWLQQYIGTTVDGHIGPATLDAAQHCNARAVADQLIARMERYYRTIAAQHANLSGYLDGWLNASQALREFVHHDLRSV